MWPSLIGGGLSLLGGLFAQSSQDRREREARELSESQFQTLREDDADAPRRNIMSQLEGVFEGADTYGFNPLTLLQLGQPGGAMPTASATAMGGGAPLASLDLIRSGLEQISDVVSGDAGRRAAAQELETDLLRLQVDQLRGAVARPSAAATVGSGVPVLGGRSVEGVGISDMLWNPHGVTDMSGNRLRAPDIGEMGRSFNEWAAPYIEAGHDTLFGWMEPARVPEPIQDKPPQTMLSPEPMERYASGLNDPVSPAERRAREAASAFDDEETGGYGWPFRFPW